MVVQLTFDFEVQLLRSKEREGYSDRSGPRILEIDLVIRKLSRFSQVQSERERTFVLSDICNFNNKYGNFYVTEMMFI